MPPRETWLESCGNIASSLDSLKSYIIFLEIRGNSYWPLSLKNCNFSTIKIGCWFEHFPEVLGQNQLRFLNLQEIF